jgi:alkanesulfonate monooxygenase SsuD/methylene tetrahydromethanopterin reductase-like flavin-dependent oxidoreductase (luciferase family)
MSLAIRRGAFVLLAIIAAGLIAMSAPGCALLGSGAEVDPEADRYRAVRDVLEEHIERHPEQAETWRGFLNTWREQIEGRGGNVAEPPPLVPIDPFRR